MHGANTLLLFGLLHRMTGALARSGFVAALFAAHPAHVESVAWISERKDVLSTLFWMLTLWAYLAYLRRPRGGRYAVVCLTFALGLMAKPMLVTLPFVLLLLDDWPLGRLALGPAPPRPPAAPAAIGRVSPGQAVREKLPLFALAAASSVVTFLVQRQGGAVSGLAALPFGRRLANALVSYVAYLGTALWPANLAAIYPYPRSLPAWGVAASALGLLALSVLLVGAHRRRPYLTVGWLWYLGTLVPVIGLVQVGIQPIADRYTYVPLIGLFLIVAWGAPELVARWSARRVALPLAAGVVIAASAVTARAQVQYWHDSIALWEHALAATGENAHAHVALGSVLVEQGGADEAIAHFSEAVRIEPDFAEAHNKLGAALADKGKVDAAMLEYAAALRLKPNLAEAHNNVGNVLAREGKIDEAVAEYRQALRVKPDDAVAHNGFGSVLDDQGKVDEAIGQYREALRIKPDFAEAHNNLGAALSKQGKLDDALREFLEAARIKPRVAAFHYNAALQLDRQGQTIEAIAQLEAGLTLDPTNQAASKTLEDLKQRTKASRPR